MFSTISAAFANLRISYKIGAAFGLLLLLIAALGSAALLGTSRMNASTNDIVANWMPSIRLLGDMRYNAARQRTVAYRIMAETTDEGLRAMDQALDRFGAVVRDSFTRYEREFVTSEDERTLLRAVGTAYQAYQEQVAPALAAGRRRDQAEATRLLGPTSESFSRFEAALNALTDFNVRGADAAGEAAGATAASASTSALVMLIAAFVLGIAAAWAIVRGVSTPIVAMTNAMRRLADHDLATDIPARGRRDEVGQMADAVQVFKDNMIRADALAAEQKAAQEERERRAAKIESLTKGFDTQSQAIVGALSAAATELQSSAETLKATADQTSQQSTVVASASGQASANVQTVASAAEELSSSVAEISRQVAESAQIAGRAMDEAKRTDAKVQGLADAAQKIGDVVKLINDIAGQTNLLALNATIEAARAGEAGKGFAVVASEVKSLATQTSKATDEIATQIEQIQAATQDAVAAIKSIGGTIVQVNEIATSIASAVEEQGAATREIARNVQEASKGTSEVASSITHVSSGAKETGRASGELLTTAGDVAKQSEVLKREVDGFLAGVRAA